MPEEHYCTKCGGTDVITSTSADLWWDAVKQEYVISSICDGGTDHCDTCWAETDCDWRPVTDKKTLARIAKRKGDT